MSIQHFKKWDENNYARVKLCLFFVDKQLKQHAFENTHLKTCWPEISTVLHVTFKSNWNVPHTSFLKLDPSISQFWETILASHSCAIVRVLFKSKDCIKSKIPHKKGRQFFNEWHWNVLKSEPLKKERNEEVIIYLWPKWTRQCMIYFRNLLCKRHILTYKI